MFFSVSLSKKCISSGRKLYLTGLWPPWTAPTSMSVVGTTMTTVYLAVVVYVLVKKWFKKTPELWCIAAITGGAIGNFIDRISSGLVIDMICIPWFSTFNVADLFITFGALILVVYILVKDKALLADEPKKKPEAGHDADAR